MARLSKRSYLALLAILLLSLTLFRLWFCTRIELVADEAYYYLWSRHLDIGYYDKGPVIAWLIHLSSLVGGTSEFGVRWLGVVLSSLTGWLIFCLGKAVTGSERIAFWAVVVACSIPLLAVGSVIMTIDTPLVFFWVLAAWGFWKALHSGSAKEWFLTGLAVGLGFLSKFNSGIEFACFVGYLCLIPRHRHYLWSRQLLFLSLGFALCLIPMIYWNATHQWINVFRVASRGGLDHHFHFHPINLLKFLEQQALIVSPLLFAGMLTAVFVSLFRDYDKENVAYLLMLFLPLFVFFCFFSLNETGKGNWTAAALPAGILLLVIYWEKRIERQPVWRWTAVLALGLALVETGLLHHTSFLHLKKDPMDRARGWRDLASRVQIFECQYHPDSLICNNYQTASLLSFYLPGQPSTFTPSDGQINDQLCFWGTYPSDDKVSALFVSEKEAAVPDELKRQFPVIAPVSDFTTEEQGRKLEHFWIYWCHH